MKTIYITQRQWRNHTLSGELDRAVGDTGRMAGPFPRNSGLQAGKDRVIDLAAWKAENLVELDGDGAVKGPESALGQYEGRELVRRPHRKHAASRARAELAATLAVVGVVVVLLLRVLVF